MKKTEFIKQRKALYRKLDAFKKEINKEYTKLTKQYVAANSPVKEGKVYEMTDSGGGSKRRGFNRFVAYTHDISFHGEHPMIRVGGWWLDKDSVPAKWDNYTVVGVVNPAVFVLSKDQTNKNHPEKNKK